MYGVFTYEYKMKNVETGEVKMAKTYGKNKAEAIKSVINEHVYLGKNWKALKSSFRLVTTI